MVDPYSYWQKFYFLMDEKTAFERYLYEDGKEIFLNDIEFCVDRLIMLPKIRPHQLEKSVRLSIEFCRIADFRRSIIEKSNQCPVLIYQLYKRGILVFEEIEPFLRYSGSFLLCYYFRKVNQNFDSFVESKQIPSDINKSILENSNQVDQMIEYGFMTSSIEYCLKYDVIENLFDFNISNQEAIWSPFEWSIRPKYHDFLSFSGFFGSIKCFKHLLMKGFEVNEKVMSMVVCSGSFDLYHLCQNHCFLSINQACFASEFYHLPLLVYFIENGVDVNTKVENDFSIIHIAASSGHLSVVEYLVNQKADINAKDNRVEFLDLIGLLFIMLLKMVILVLLNI